MGKPANKTENPAKNETTQKPTSALSMALQQHGDTSLLDEAQKQPDQSDTTDDPVTELTFTSPKSNSTRDQMAWYYHGRRSPASQTTRPDSRSSEDATPVMQTSPSP